MCCRSNARLTATFSTGILTFRRPLKGLTPFSQVRRKPLCTRLRVALTARKRCLMNHLPLSSHPAVLLPLHQKLLCLVIRCPAHRRRGDPSRNRSCPRCEVRLV